MNNERICMVNPNHHYEYCPRCAQYAFEPTWKLEFCSEECRSIYMTVNRFNFGHITLEEAREELAGVDLSDRENFRYDVKAVLDRIFTDEQPTNANNEIAAEPFSKKFQKKKR